MSSERAYEGSDAFIDLELDNGDLFRFRRLVPADRAAFADGIKSLSGRSRYLRFFSGFSEAPEPLLDALSNIDGKRHLAWGALDLSKQNAPPVAAVHAIAEPELEGSVEIACTVLDDYHHRGIARILLLLLTLDCLAAGYEHISVLVLRENKDALKLFTALGAEYAGSEVGGPMRLEADALVFLEKLSAMRTPHALQTILQKNKAS